MIKVESKLFIKVHQFKHGCRSLVEGQRGSHVNQYSLGSRFKLVAHCLEVMNQVVQHHDIVFPHFAQIHGAQWGCERLYIARIGERKLIAGKEGFETIRMGSGSGTYVMTANFND